MVESICSFDGLVYRGAGDLELDCDGGFRGPLLYSLINPRPIRKREFFFTTLDSLTISAYRRTKLTYWRHYLVVL